jgi:glutaredoxin
MKKYIIIIVITFLIIYQKQEGISALLFTPTDYSAAHDVDVLMYGTSWCRYCAKARKLLDDHDITYFEYDIESSREGAIQYKDLGGRGVPVFQIGGKVLKGYNPARILQLVDEVSLGIPEQN